MDGAFNQKPILTRMVVALAGLALVAVVGAIVFIVNQDDGDDRSAEESQQADQPTGFDAVAAAGIVTLSWDKAIGVTSYKLKQTAPEDDESAIVDSPVADNPARLQSRIRVETEDDYCYRLIAVVDGAPESAPSEERCLHDHPPVDRAAGPHRVPDDRPHVARTHRGCQPVRESPVRGESVERLAHVGREHAGTVHRGAEVYPVRGVDRGRGRGCDRARSSGAGCPRIRGRGAAVRRVAAHAASG